MLLLFMVEGDRYGMDVMDVVEVIPFIPLKRLPHTPNYVAGVFNYRGQAVPVIDVSMLISGKSAQSYFSTRIVIVNYPLPNGHRYLLGLITEHATETIKASKSDFISSGLRAKGNEYLGQLLMDEKGMVQCIEMNRLLPSELITSLYERQAGPSAEIEVSR